jgi:predicted ATPase/class 3 adenylate cyclase
VRPDLPSGTVTFLFTDVEGSTRLLDELGAEDYAAALAEHRRIVRKSSTEQGGAEVDTQGDAFFFAFPTAPGALAAARAIVEGLSSGRVQVRIGLHTGTPLLTEEGYVGADVHRAARIAAAGHGGQVLVSAATAVLSAEPELLLDLGEHRFKDLAAAERVFQLGEREFAPLKTLYRTNLPVPTTEMVGRELELAEIVELLQREDLRLLTLSGPGGTGKTRLAIQSAAEAAESYPDGVWWVSLAPLRDAHLLVSSLADALQVEDQPGRELAESLAVRLDGKRALLLLDNAEHLLPAVADEIARLRDAAGPTTLVTSRERLQLQGEHVYAVPALAEDEGVELFVTRARALDSAMQTSSAVVELCSRLDNLPLALELAAARTVVFSPEQLLERLSQRLDLLKAGRDADPRQQTLRATIEWSYDLLDDTEQRLFRALSVCAGGCSYESAEAVGSADPDTLQSLLDKSLLRRRESQLGPRYWMLETIRELAAQKLATEGETEAMRRRHAEHYLALARSANLDAEAEGQQRHDLVIPERDNMRAALAWALEADEREFGLELVLALENFWATSAPQEGVDWVVSLLDGASGVPDRLLVRALRVQGGMENMLGQIDLAIQRWEQALAIARELGDEQGVAVLLHRLADMARLRGDLPGARALAEESLAGHRRVGFRKGETQALTSLAEVARAEGDLDGALALLHESRPIAEAVGFRWWLSGVLARIGAVSLELGKLQDARRNAEQALALSRAMHDRKAVVYELGLLAEIAAEAGDRRRAGILWGAAEAENERAPAGRWIHGAIEPERVLAHADSEFGEGRAGGRELSLEDAGAFALEGGEGSGPVSADRAT